MNLFDLLSITVNLEGFPQKEYVVVPEGKPGDHEIVDLVEERFSALGIDILDVNYSREGNSIIFNSMTFPVTVRVSKIMKDHSKDYLETLAVEYEQDLQDTYIALYA
ncbi:hypothetical protein ACQR3P_28670 [Rhodococcus sp. IEGM1300]